MTSNGQKEGNHQNLRMACKGKQMTQVKMYKYLRYIIGKDEKIEAEMTLKTRKKTKIF